MARARTAAAVALLAVTIFSSVIEGRVLAELSPGQIAASTDPASVLQRFPQARNQGDVDAAMQLVSDDIRFTADSACTVQVACVAASTFRGELEQSIGHHVQTLIVSAAQGSGTAVRVSILLTSPGRTAIGVDRTLADVSAAVATGRIVSFRSDPDSDDAQTRWWLDHKPASHSTASSSGRSRP